MRARSPTGAPGGHPSCARRCSVSSAISLSLNITAAPASGVGVDADAMACAELGAVFWTDRGAGGSVMHSTLGLRNLIGCGGTSGECLSKRVGCDCSAVSSDATGWRLG